MGYRWILLGSYLFIATLPCAAYWSWQRMHWQVTPLVLLGLTLLIILAQWVYKLRTERLFDEFLAAIKAEDFTFTTQTKYHKNKALLHEVMEAFRKLRAEKQIQYEHLQRIVAHLDVGICCYQADTGAVIVQNTAFLKWMDKPLISNINQLKYFRPQLAQLLENTTSGSTQLEEVIQGKLHRFIVRVSDLKTPHETIRSVLLQNMHDELDSSALDAWKKLMRVLTHEMMNSLTPVVALADTVHQHLQKPDELTQNESLREEVQAAAGVIRNRSEKLLRFVQNYRTLAKLPEPQLSAVNIHSLLREMEQLFLPVCQAHHIHLEYTFPAHPNMVLIDPVLTEQALINLIKNAIEALKDTPNAVISISVNTHNEGTEIHIQDNGPGIHAENLEAIFVPFFTTKMNGSGIGLSLSKQIARSMGGNIYVQTSANGSIFTLLVKNGVPNL